MGLHPDGTALQPTPEIAAIAQVQSPAQVAVPAPAVPATLESTAEPVLYPAAEIVTHPKVGLADLHGEERVWSAREILGAPSFWKQALGYMFAYGMLLVTLVYQFPFILNHGFNNQTAALIVSGYAVRAAISRFGWGYLADRLPVRWVAVASIWLAAFGVVFLIFGTDLNAIWLYTIISGSGISGLAALQSMVTAGAFGRRSFGTVVGMLNPMNQLTAAIAVPLTGYIYYLTHSYRLAQAIFSLLAVATSLSLLALPYRIGAALTPASST